uniref:Uncharacterized protein n=1 Tax=Anguilla anguilla TaxID=7936 RepID=A0A0E9Y272_ANGAN
MINVTIYTNNSIDSNRSKSTNMYVYIYDSSTVRLLQLCHCFRKLRSDHNK